MEEITHVNYVDNDHPAYTMPKEEIVKALIPVLTGILMQQVQPHEVVDMRAKALPVVEKYLYELPLDNLTQKYIQAESNGTIWSDEELKDIKSRFNNSDDALSAEEERLLSAANRLKTKSNDTNLEDFIRGDCRINEGNYKEVVVNRVLSRLNKTESGHSSGAMGKGHDPNKQFKRISDVIKSMRAF